MRRRLAAALSVILGLSFVVAVPTVASAEPVQTPSVVINEVEPDATPDWIELANTGDADVDISGWMLRDEDLDHEAPLRDGLIVPAHGYLVLAKDDHFSYGLGKSGDQVHLTLADGTLVDEFTYTSDPETTWGRCPDGTGEFAITASVTQGAANDCAPQPEPEATTGSPADLVLNEVESQASNSGSDWIELYNPTGSDIDATGLVAKDSGEGNTLTLPAGSTVPARGYLSVDVSGLGGSDSARLFAADGTTLIDQTSWTAHAEQTWGRCPDGTGEFGQTLSATPGAANDCAPAEGGDTPVAGAGAIRVNEIESSGGNPGDWVELKNISDTDVDLAGWILKDDKDDHALRIPAGTSIAAGGYTVIYTDLPGDGFGLGDGDAARLFLPDGTTLVDSHSYPAHAQRTTWGRCPDGTGAFVETYSSTPGAANDCSPIRINEVDSKGAEPLDWIELTNAGTETVDISGYILRDNDDAHAVVIPNGTTLQPGTFVTIDVDVQGGFGLGAADAARLFAPDGTTLLDQTSWSEHADTSWARCPDGLGEFEVAASVTKGAPNDCIGLVAATPWPGDAGVSAVSGASAFGKDMSGLAYEATGDGRGTLWAVNNGTGTLFQLEWNASAGQWVTPEVGEWKAGKVLRYPGGSGAVDAEGVSLVAGNSANGVYVATERNNDASNVSRPSVLRFDVSTSGTELIATDEWSLASLLPTLPANGGLEGVTWVPDSVLVAQVSIRSSEHHRYCG